VREEREKQKKKLLLKKNGFVRENYSITQKIIFFGVEAGGTIMDNSNFIDREFYNVIFNHTTILILEHQFWF
jgi:hypothetical protein